MSVLDRDVLQRRLRGESPNFARSVRTYVAEADFFHPLVATSLSGRGPLTVLEVGAGVGLLAMRLAADGHHVVAFEPQSAGFDRNRAIRQLLQACWTGPAPVVEWHETVFAPDLLDPARPVDVALSLNVLEHVADPAGLVQQVVASLGPAGTYRVICPNYAVPYEPHFNIPTVWSKSWTGRLFSRRIDTADMPDPQGLWDELSWPTQRGLARALAARGVEVTFDRRATHAYLDRALGDPAFADRKGPVLAGVVRLVGGSAGTLVDRLPTSLLPVIDATASSRDVPAGG